jgi:hypothetical protein
MKSPGLLPFVVASDEERCAMPFDADMKFDVRLGMGWGLGVGWGGVGWGGFLGGSAPCVAAARCLCRAPQGRAIGPALTPTLHLPPHPPFKPHSNSNSKVEEYYFHHYATHFVFGVIGEALRSIPYVMTWDDVRGPRGGGLVGHRGAVLVMRRALPRELRQADHPTLLLLKFTRPRARPPPQHDIFDGWGSYPERLQLCQVFQVRPRRARPRGTVPAAAATVILRAALAAACSSACFNLPSPPPPNWPPPTRQ